MWNGRKRRRRRESIELTTPIEVVGQSTAQHNMEEDPSAAHLSSCYTFPNSEDEQEEEGQDRMVRYAFI